MIQVVVHLEAQSVADIAATPLKLTRSWTSAVASSSRNVEVVAPGDDLVVTYLECTHTTG